MTVDNPGDNAERHVDKRLAVGASNRDARQDRHFHDSPHRVCRSALDGVVSELEAERFSRPVPEFRPAFSRDYLDLLAIADAHIRAQDEQEERSA